MPIKTKTPRADAEIMKDLQRRMKVDERIPEDRITLRVAEGVVTIEGTVEQLLQREAAQTCAAKVKGVRVIENRLRVVPTVRALEN